METNVKDLVKKYVGKYISIKDCYLHPDEHKCMHVIDVFPDKMCKDILKFAGSGYDIEDDGLNGITCNIANLTINPIIIKEIKSGDVQITILTKDEYEEELRKLIEYINKNLLA